MLRAPFHVVTALFLLGSVEGAFSQSTDFIQLLPTADLTPTQNQALERIRNLATTADVKIVRVNSSVLRSFGKIAIPTNVGVVAVQNTTTNIQDARSFNWTGKTEDRLGGTSTIAVNGDSVTGTIETEDGQYRIRPLGGTTHVLIKVDATRFPPEHPPAFLERRNQLRDLPPIQKKSESDTSITELRVLVAYTPAVAATVPDVKGLMDLAFLETNNSYQNSGVRIRLIASPPNPVMTTYLESGSHETDLAAFRNRSDGKMDDIHAVRANAKASIGLLLTNNEAYCGLASDILATKDTAFAVVYHDCATGYYSFAHEIGHLQGARHNPEADPSTTPYPYGHGFTDAVRKRRTIMGYDCPNGCRREAQWARPPEWGTPDTHHDARVLNETALYVSGFAK